MTKRKHEDVTAVDSNKTKPKSLPDLIAQTALDHYYLQLPPTTGKPQPGREWTVYSAIVATTEQIVSNYDTISTSSTFTSKTCSLDEITNNSVSFVTPVIQNINNVRAWVVSCATGSKCTAWQSAQSTTFHQVEIPTCQLLNHTNAATPNDNSSQSKSEDGSFQCKSQCCSNQIKGCVVHDSHAEVLARRGLIRVLWNEIRYHLLEWKRTHNHNPHTKSLEEMNDTVRVDTCSSDSKDNHCQSNLLLQMIPNSDESTLQKVDELDDHFETNGHGFIKNFSFVLRPYIKLHLYISDSPCGDASIYKIKPKYQQNQSFGTSNNDNTDNEPTINFTGAKIITSSKVGTESLENDRENFIIHCPSHQTNDNINIPSPLLNRQEQQNKESRDQISNQKVNQMTNIIAREKIQITSAIRLKSGRSNIPNHLRSQSMSCSDKICKWVLFGLQGSGILSALLHDPIHLSSIVVSRDHRIEQDYGNTNNDTNNQYLALKRAIVDRAEIVYDCLNNTNQDKETKSPLVKIPCVLEKCIPTVHTTDYVFNQSKTVTEKEIIDRNHRDSNIIENKESPTSNDAPSNRNKTSKGDETSKSETKCKQQQKRLFSPCGICLNWQQQSNTLLNHPIACQSQKKKCKSQKENGMVESIVGAQGIKQGKKPKSAQDITKKSTSRLSRCELLVEAINILHQLVDCGLLSLEGIKILSMMKNGDLSYSQIKSKSRSDISKLKEMIFVEIENPLQGWLRNNLESDFYHHG